MVVEVTQNLTQVTISSVGVQGPKGEPGTSTLGQNIDFLATTASLNNFTSSYYSDSASFANRLNNATNEQDLSTYLSASLFNNLSASFATSGSNTFTGTQQISGSILISGSIVPATANGTFTSSFSLGSPTNAWKDIYVSQGSIIFVDAITQATSSFTIANNQEVKYSNGITASYYDGDGSRLRNLPSTTDWKTGGEIIVGNTEQLTFSGDYVLDNVEMTIEGSDTEIEYSPGKYFKKIGKIFIGGNLLVKDSWIINNGLISVGGQVILIGNSQIEGTGTII